MPKRRFSDELRKAVSDAPMTRYAISKATGIDQASLSRFVRGQARLSMESLDALAKCLGWSLCAKLRKE